jgi:hypothetical protein
MILFPFLLRYDRVETTVEFTLAAMRTGILVNEVDFLTLAADTVDGTALSAKRTTDTFTFVNGIGQHLTAGL